MNFSHLSDLLYQKKIQERNPLFSTNIFYLKFFPKQRTIFTPPPTIKSRAKSIISIKFITPKSRLL
ncbi:hypothetical protein CQA58_07895 [Helicobacter brantae]|uniref:Uncharacterized protein n=1 Tax=Helicobacter brantae TaxID=375927 RepID=A0A3D8IW42_9HELI|nr:hypothetical protein CQA58_07895 [Helicobacter brantae]